MTEIHRLGTDVVVAARLLGSVNTSSAAIERQSLAAEVHARLWKFRRIRLDVAPGSRPPGTENATGHN